MFRFLFYPFNLLIDSLEGVGRYVELMASMFRSIFSWHKYLSLTVDHLFHIGVLSIPIVILTSLFSGMVTSVQAAYQFESGFVPNWFVGSIVGESVLLELAPMMTALVMTGRVGATIAAEIGTMIAALGTSIHDEFNIEKIRYHRVIIMTDADVDGAHIRTLLLTFFYRHMPEIVQRGYLYIAQPPLFKVKRGTAEVYKKDQRALDDFLIDEGLKGARLMVGQSREQEARTGDDLREIVERARAQCSRLRILARRVTAPLVEQAAIAGVLNLELLNDTKNIQRATQYIADRLNKLADPGEDGWSGSGVIGECLAFEHNRRGVVNRYEIDVSLVQSTEARSLDADAAMLQEIYAHPASFQFKDRTYTIHGPTSLFQMVVSQGRKGANIQRYKGLGEMNPNQLWETTLDPEARNLFQVKVSHADDADDLFSTLMGDLVEPRREFIQQNALDVANLDV